VEFSGKITQLGTGVSQGWKVGDEVLGLVGGVSDMLVPGTFIVWVSFWSHYFSIQGAYAEYIAVNETHIIAKPFHLTWVEAASIPEVFLTGKYEPNARRCQFFVAMENPT
jgi:NADPH:quinone reductase-like Zn-dependent oxidoreductase